MYTHTADTQSQECNGAPVKCDDEGGILVEDEAGHQVIQEARRTARAALRWAHVDSVDAALHAPLLRTCSSMVRAAAAIEDVQSLRRWKNHHR